MHPISTRVARIGAAALGAAALAVLGVAAPALAAQTGTVDTTQDGHGVLHVVKSSTDTRTATDGKPHTVAAADAVAGAGFTIYPVQTSAGTTVSLTTNQGWADAATAVSGVATTTADTAATVSAKLHSGFKIGAAVGAEVTTDATGDATFGSLALAEYLVVETTTPAGSAGAVAPYFVTVPMTDSSNHNAWLYTVYTYPKNVITTPTKTVTDDTAYGLGDTITYTVTVPLTHANGNTYSSLSITDALPTGLALTGTTPVTVAVSGVATQPATSAYTITGANVTFTSLASLNDPAATAVVETITAKATTTGSFDNHATIAVNGATAKSTATVTTKWGSLTIRKTNGTSGLNGAVFSLYPTLADAKAGTNAITVSGATTFTTATVGGVDGIVKISGLRYTGYYSHASSTATTTDAPYYLVEVTAPAGYELLAEPVAVSVTGTTGGTTADKTIVDVPTNAGFTLPLTGGTGTAIVYISGGVVLGLGIALIIVLARRRRSAER